MFTVNDVALQVQDKLRGRQGLNYYNGRLESNIPSWIYQAVVDITPNVDFEELIIKGPYVNFQLGVAEYPIDYFENKDNPRFVKIRSFFRFFTTQNPPPLPTALNVTGPSQQTGSWLKSRAPSVIEPMSVIPGLPTHFCQNGRTFLFGPAPNDTYTVFMRFQQKHPWNIATLPTNPILMPDDWQEVVAYLAAIKGCEHLGMNEVANMYYMKLHGDPKKPGDIGLLTQKRTQLARNLDINERQLQPILTRYTG